MTPPRRARLPADWQRWPEPAKRALAQQLWQRAYWRDPAAFLLDCFAWEHDYPTDYQLETLSDLFTLGRVAERGPHGLGKALDLNTPLPTPAGWTTMGAVAPGDLVLDEHGAPARVTFKSAVSWREAFEVRFSDGSAIVADGDHLWRAVDVYERPKGITDWRAHWDATKVRTTAQIAATLRTPAGQARWRIPTASPVQGQAREHGIEPYLLGVWLGDGHTASGRITLNRADAPQILARIGRAWHVAPSGEAANCRTVTVDGLHRDLRLAGLLGNKRIPPEYLRASIDQRREIVRGLFDTDGYRQRSGGEEITLTAKALVDDVLELLRSLGLVVRCHESDAKLNGRIVGRRWRISTRFDFRPYTLARYDWKPAARQASRHTQRTITDVVPVGQRPVACIAVDTPRHLYLAGEAMIPTHNTATAAWAILFFAFTRDGRDWKAVTTASVWRQLTEYLWPEIHKWTRRLRYDRLQRDPLVEGKDLQEMHLKLTTGEAFAVASNDPANIEGAHADHLLFIYDEAKTIPGDTFDATEGAFSGAGPESGREAFALAISTPGEPAGRFYDLCRRAPGFEDWTPRHITLERAVDAGRVSASWAAGRARQWGEDSAVYQNRVRGEFAAQEASSVIPLSWVEAAVERGRFRRRAIEADPSARGPLTRIGADIADGGEDDTVFALRYGHAVDEIRIHPTGDTMATTGHLMGIARANPKVEIVVDVIGIGAGVVARLRELRAREGTFAVLPFNAGEGSKRTDLSGEMEFKNKRAEVWWGMREKLDPANAPTICLPDDDRMIGDLTAPHWSISSSGKILIESKDDIRKRIGRSTDVGDAVVMAFWSTSTAARILTATSRQVPRLGPRAGR